MLNIVCPSASNDIEVVSSRCADRQVNILWGDPSNNTRFHSCLNYETAIVLTCPWSYHFFEDEQACLPPLLLDTSTTMASTQPDEITIVTNLPVTRPTDLPVPPTRGPLLTPPKRDKFTTILLPTPPTRQRITTSKLTTQAIETDKTTIKVQAAPTRHKFPTPAIQDQHDRTTVRMPTPPTRLRPKIELSTPPIRDLIFDN